MLATSNISVGTEGQPWMKALAAGNAQRTASASPGSLDDSNPAEAAMRDLPVNDGRVQYNPVLDYDRKAQVVLVQFIDPATGEVDKQYPSEKQIEAYQKAMDEQQGSLPELTTPEGMENGPAGDLDESASDGTNQDVSVVA